VLLAAKYLSEGYVRLDVKKSHVSFLFQLFLSFASQR
jgi:hypothetical protein